MKKLLKAITHPSLVLNFLLGKTTRMWSTKTYLAIRHRLNGLGPINWNNPQTYTEKCSWMKLYYHNPLFTQLADKIEAKKYVEEKLGPGYTFTLLETYDSPDEIDFEKLPNKFVLKCNHNSGSGMVICKDKANMKFVKGKETHLSVSSYEEIREGLRVGLAEDYYLTQREWPYKNIKRRILAEKFYEQSDGSGLSDYKFFCFNGEPKYIWMGTNYTPTHFDIYSTDWKNQHVAWGYDNAPEDVPPPPGFEQMLELARKLSAGIPHVRVDFYNIDGRIYVGEFTFYTWAGLKGLIPSEWNKKLGDLIQLPKPMQDS